MPDRIEPCLALLKAKPLLGPDWIYEIKWDGYRLAVHIERNSVRIITRGGHDWTHRFPAVAAAARKLGVGTAIFDAEGRSDFRALQRSLGGRGGKKASGDAILYAFDLMYFDGHDLTKMSVPGRDWISDARQESGVGNDNGWSVPRSGPNCRPTIRLIDPSAYKTPG